MSDIKLFRLGEVVSELQGEAVQVEKSLQKLFEGNLEALLGDLKKAKPSTAKGTYVKKVTLSTTMGPGLIIDQSTLEA